MPRIFLPYSDLTSNLVTISGEKARYISSVLRLSSGDKILITDDKGNSYSAEIVSSSRKEIKVELIGKETLNTEPILKMTLFQGLLKGEKMDLVVQKAVELGVIKIIPVITERSQLRETKKLPRWRKIAEEASRQSGRSVVPEITETTDFGDIFTAHNCSSDAGIIFWELGGDRLSGILDKLNQPEKINLFTGPEGGFSEKEIRTASENGFVTASLGKRILRAETAAIAAVAIIQYRFGDMG